MLVPYLVVPLQFLLTPPATALYVLDHAEPHPQNHRWPHLLLRPLLPTRRRQAQDCPPSLFGQTRRPHRRYPDRRQLPQPPGTEIAAFADVTALVDIAPSLDLVPLPDFLLPPPPTPG